MTPLRLLWRVLTGKDAQDTLRNTLMLEEHKRRIEALERKQQALDTFSQFGRDARR